MLTLASLRSDIWTASPELVDDFIGIRTLVGAVWWAAKPGGLLVGNYTSPNVTTRLVADGGCSKCHADLTWVSERPGHYHSPWLRRRWRAAGGPANTCEACRPSHKPVASAADRFMGADHVQAQRDACHNVTGGGGGSFEP